MDIYCLGLIDEIAFWQELIDESSLEINSPEHLRMQHALQLAENRLSKYRRTIAVTISEAFND